MSAITLKSIKDDLSLYYNYVADIKRNRRSYIGRCPLHHDRKPSLIISQKYGALVWYCFPCSKGGSIIDLVMAVRGCDEGEAIRELTNNPARPAPTEFKPIPEKAERPFTVTVREVSTYAARLKSGDDTGKVAAFLEQSGLSRIAAELRLGYDPSHYFTCGGSCQHCGKSPALTIPLYWQGQLVGLKFRNLDAPDASHKWSQAPGSKGDFLWFADVPPVDPASQVVGVFEGVRDTALARALGFNAVGILSTSTVPEREPSDRFAESINRIRETYDHAALVGDADEAGEAAKIKLRRHLGHGAIFAHNLEKYKDLSAFDEAEGEAATKDALRRVYAAVDECAAFRDKASSKEATDSEEIVITESFTDVKSKAIDWLWKDRIPKAKLIIFSGNPDVGKSTVTCDIVARYTTGKPWPDGAANGTEPGRVLMLLAEDDAADTVKPRLEAAGADVDRVHRITGINVPLKAGRQRCELALDKDLVAIERTLKSNREIGLIVIDPLTSYLGKADMNKEQEVRRVLGPIKELCERTGVTIIGPGHFNKRGDVAAIHKVGGAVAMSGIARAVWLFAKNPKDDGEYLMMLGKGNLTRKRTGLRYCITACHVASGEAPVIDWRGEHSEDTDRVIQAASDPELKKAAKAERILTEALAGGERGSDEILQLAAKKGIGRSTLFDAKKRLDVRAVKKDRQWFWELPRPGPAECEN